MRALRRRAIGCAAVAATGAVLLAAASAQAQKPANVGNGIKTGQMGVQLFNYGGFINNGGGAGANPPAMGVSPACVTSTTSECRWERLERLFAYLQSKGVTNVELFGPLELPGQRDTANLIATARCSTATACTPAAGTASMSETDWDARIAAAKVLGADYIGSGGLPRPGHQQLRRHAAHRPGPRTGSASGRSRPASGPCTSTTTRPSSPTSTSTTGSSSPRIDIIMERTDPRYVVAEIDVKWSSDALDDVTGTLTAAFINKPAYQARVQMLHIKDGINIAAARSRRPLRTSPPAPARSTSGRSSPPPSNRVRYYHQEHDGGTLTDAEISLTNLKGIGPASLGTPLGLPPSFNPVPAGTPAASNVTPLVIQNTGDQPLTITNVQVQGDGRGRLRDREPELLRRR